MCVAPILQNKLECKRINQSYIKIMNKEMYKYQFITLSPQVATVAQ